MESGRYERRRDFIAPSIATASFFKLARSDTVRPSARDSLSRIALNRSRKNSYSKSAFINLPDGPARLCRETNEKLECDLLSRDMRFLIYDRKE